MHSPPSPLGPSPAPDLTMDVAVVQGLLDERGWTWANLADRMGVAKSTVSRVVRYQTRPGRKFIFALQDVFPGRQDLFVNLGGPVGSPASEDGDAA